MLWVAGMASHKVRNYRDAEEVALRWVREKFPRVLRVRFRRVWREADIWIVEGTVEVRTGILSKSRRGFKLQLDGNTGEVLGYSK